MSEWTLPKIKQSEKYPDETTSFILGNCYDEKQTAEIARRCNSHDALVEEIKANTDAMRAGSQHIITLIEQRDALLAACEKADWLFEIMIKEGMLNADSDVKEFIKAAIAKAKPAAAPAEEVEK